MASYQRKGALEVPYLEMRLKYTLEFEHGAGTISLKDSASKQRWWGLPFIYVQLGAKHLCMKQHRMSLFILFTI